MNQTDLSSCSFTELADFLRHAHSPGVWSKSDFAALWAHQLSTPLWSELASQKSSPQSALGDASEEQLTFGTALLVAKVPLPLLLSVKQYAQSHREAETSVLPAEIALMLYYLSLATAWALHRERITSMNDESLREGWRWATRQEWIDSRTRVRLESVLLDFRAETQK